MIFCACVFLQNPFFYDKTIAFSICINGFFGFISSFLRNVFYFKFKFFRHTQYNNLINKTRALCRLAKHTRVV